MRFLVEEVENNDYLDYIQEWAVDDYRNGHVFDPYDFNEFKHILLDDYPELKDKDDKFIEGLFRMYYDFIDDVKSYEMEDYYSNLAEEDLDEALGLK